MRAIFCLFDSLNLRALGGYGGSNIPTPNFDRLARRGITFDNHFIGNLRCIAARRDLYTGRLHFMHRSWGPLERFDISFPELLDRAGIYAHLATDHNHYFEDDGATYHSRFTSYEFIPPVAVRVPSPPAKSERHRSTYEEQRPRAFFRR